LVALIVNTIFVLLNSLRNLFVTLDNHRKARSIHPDATVSTDGEYIKLPKISYSIQDRPQTPKQANRNQFAVQIEAGTPAEKRAKGKLTGVSALALETLKTSDPPTANASPLDFG